MAGNGIDIKALSDIDKLKLENLQLKAQLLNVIGEHDALRTRIKLDKTIQAFDALAKEIMTREKITEGWQLDLEKGCWHAPEQSMQVDNV